MIKRRLVLPLAVGTTLALVPSSGALMADQEQPSDVVTWLCAPWPTQD